MIQAWHPSLQTVTFFCRSIGCLCPDCELCKQAQHRRCTSCFAPKYLSGDALKAKCGAPIVVELINPATGDVVSSDKVSDIQLEVSDQQPEGSINS